LWNAGRLGGIEFRIHITFLLLIVGVGASHWTRANSMDAMLNGVGFMNALAARKFGIQTKDITLLPIGGVARLERMPDDPAQELWAALAGPAVIVAVAVALYGAG